jgi:hypothetical protein
MLRKWHEIWSQVVFSRRLKDLCRDRLHRIDGTTPTGPRHIRAIAVAKGFQHHSLLPCDAAKEQNPKTDKPSESVFGRVVVVSFFIITLSHPFRAVGLSLEVGPGHRPLCAKSSLVVID